MSKRAVKRPSVKQGPGPKLAPVEVQRPSEKPFGRFLSYALYTIFPLLFALAGASFVRLEKNAIYLWDFATYWNQVLQLANFLKQGGSLWVALKTVYKSTAESHYNLLPSLPLVPFQWLGLDPRTAYIVSICVLYVGLLYGVCCILFSHYSADRLKPWAWLAGGVLCLSTCTIWWPVYRGFVDAAALAVVLAGVAFAIKAEEHRRPAGVYFLGGILMGLAPVMRKAYSYYLLAFVIVFSVAALVAAIRKTSVIKEIWAELRPKVFFFLGVAVVFAFFYGFFVSTLNTDKNVHSSYKATESIWRQFGGHLAWFGVIPCLAYVFGVLVLSKAKLFKGALVAGFGASVLGAVLQMRTNALGEHHRYILVAGFLMVLSGAVGAALSCRTQIFSKVFLSLTALSCVGAIADLHGAGSKGDFFPSAGPSPYGEHETPRPDWWLTAFGNAGPKPISRTDLGELQRLYSYLDRICASDPNPSVYILASGIVLGDGVVFSSLLTPPGLQLRCLNRFLPVQQIDSAHGAPTNLLQATHVVTTDPIQLHLPPSSHRCVTVPWNQFNEGRGIARAFERTSEEFTLENNIKAFVYRRTRPTTREDVAELEGDLRKSGLIP